MEHILSLSYGKDSLACLGAIEQLGWRLDRIVHAEVWATDTIPADLPPMVEFKARADEIIKARWEIEIEHIRAEVTYEQEFYRLFAGGKRQGTIYGWPYLRGPWCNSRLKGAALDKIDGNCVKYWGIAADELERIAKHKDKPNVKMPLVEAGWTEADCREWCEDNGLLSPIYHTAARGGCWFCHNQRISELRRLRSEYPELWAKMLVLDKASLVRFKPDKTLADFDRRFAEEERQLSFNFDLEERKE